MNAIERKAIQLQTIADFRAQAAELDKAIAGFDNVLLGQGYVVTTSSFFAITFDVSEDGVVSNPRPTKATHAIRFTKETAQRLAASVTNGNDEKAEAVHIRALLQRQADNARKCADDIEKFVK